jgi:hypothetical protein
MIVIRSEARDGSRRISDVRRPALRQPKVGWGGEAKVGGDPQPFRQRHRSIPRGQESA